MRKSPRTWIWAPRKQTIPKEAQDTLRVRLEKHARAKWRKVCRKVEVRFRDQQSAIDPASVLLTVNEAPLNEGVQLMPGRTPKLLGLSFDLGKLARREDYVVRVRVADTAAEPNEATFTLKFSTRPLLVNGGFEEGGPTPDNWGFGTWSSDGQTKFETTAVTDRPHSGEKCLMMKVTGHWGPGEDVRMV